MRITLLLLLLTALSLQKTDWFIFDGILRCKHQKPFCFHMKFYETDWLSSDDKIGEQRGCTAPGVFEHSYNVTGSQDGDGPFDSGYEVGRTIHHNCSTDGKQIDYESRHFMTSTGGGRTTINIELEEPFRYG